MQIPKYTFGIGDRFGHQGRAQLKAFLYAQEQGMEVYPVWNKSNREHHLIGSSPHDVLREALDAVETLGWKGPYFVDADHINLTNVDRFLEASDFFTIDVAAQVGHPSPSESTEQFLRQVEPYLKSISVPGMEEELLISQESALATANQFLFAMQTAGQIYRYILSQKGSKPFIVEVSVDETGKPQSPVELFLILAMIAGEKIPVQTIAPKFTGRFNKGVDYVGDLIQFEKEFEQDIQILAFAIQEFELPPTLKLSIHSGSDKFSLYPIIRRLIQKHQVGLHVKTAGTTWLEELIGLAESGGAGLALVKEIYFGALSNYNELTQPYATVIDIKKGHLPTVAEVNLWDSKKMVNTLRHDATCPDYNSNFRQLLHVAFKLAAKLGSRYTDALVKNRLIIEENVKVNLWQRHLRPIFGKN